jgi:ankyrin repeat protein
VLISATAKGHADVVEVLLENGADVHAKNNQGRTAADEAFGKGNSKINYLLREYEKRAGRRKTAPGSGEHA